VPVRFVLHRPRSSQNIGAAARALANTSAGELWVVEPLGFDRTAAARLAAGADAVLESMRVERTLEDALADCVDVVMTTSRAEPEALDPRQTAERLLASPGTAAIVFGDEVRGLTNRQLARAAAVATIPTTEKKSINLAQAVLIFAYEVMLARRVPPAAPPPPAPLADERLLSTLRERARALLLSAGFLNPQQPDAVLDELLRMLRRAHPSRREAELLLAACDQLARSLARPVRQA
jgi:tRNA/rRNA methyltransferase/tRNA (cytidine32/uridine32-2'-O)-methyltransferase